MDITGIFWGHVDVHIMPAFMFRTSSSVERVDCSSPSAAALSAHECVTKDMTASMSRFSWKREERSLKWMRLYHVRDYSSPPVMSARLKRTSPTAYCDCWEKCKCKTLIAGQKAARLDLLYRLLTTTNLVTTPNSR